MDIVTMVLIVLALLSVTIAGVVHRAYSRSQDRVQELTAKVSGLDVNLADRDSQLNSATQERDDYAIMRINLLQKCQAWRQISLIERVN